MQLKFEKWHGLKNDFIVTWMGDADSGVIIESLARMAPDLCKRDGSSVGADGILILQGETRDTPIPHSLIIINSDGSRAKNCGNGLRCAGLSVYRRAQNAERNVEIPEALELDVEGRAIGLQFMITEGSDKLPFVAVDMGEVTLDEANDWHDHAVKAVQEIAAKHDLSSVVKKISTSAIGNQHIVIDVTETSRELMETFGRALQDSPHWDGINVHVVSEAEPSDNDQRIAGQEVGGSVDTVYKTWVWERGAGPTQACGSGACSIGAYGFSTGLVDRDSWIAVDMPGGRLYIKQPEADDHISLAGPASFVFDAEMSV